MNKNGRTEKNARFSLKTGHLEREQTGGERGIRTLDPDYSR